MKKIECSWEKMSMGKIQTLGKGGSTHGKISFVFAGMYARSASDQDRVWRVTRLRKKRKTWEKFMGKIEYFWESSWEKWKKLGVFCEKKFEFGKY